MTAEPDEGQVCRTCGATDPEAPTCNPTGTGAVHDWKPDEPRQVEYVECSLGGEDVTEDEIADCPGGHIHCFDHWTECGPCVDDEVLEKRAEQAADRTEYLGET
jgi:hypothetical protein